MAKDKYPITPAVRQLKDYNIDFESYLYEYEEKGGTAQSAKELNVNENEVIKTLIFSADSKIICVLMHGNLEVSLKELARKLNVKNVLQCDEKTATNHTGYKFGGTSPFGLRKSLPVYAESTIFELEKIYINGGKQGYLIGIKPNILKTLLKAEEITVGIIK